MQMILRDLEAARPSLAPHLALDALSHHLPLAQIEQVLTQQQAHEQRRRKLPAAVMVWLCIALALWGHESVPAVFRQLVSGLRWLWPTPLRVSPSALCQARYRLGAQPLVRLFHAVAQPLTSAATPEATYHGLRLVAVDGSKLDLPDTPANARGFGRTGVVRGQAPWPQALLVGLVECASHAVLDAGLWPVQANEHAAARRVLRTLSAGMLLLYDAGLHSRALVAGAHQQGAHVLGRLSGRLRPQLQQVLADGTALVTLQGRGPQPPLPPLRLIRYTMDDPQRPGYQRVHRLLTSLTDPQQYPAQELILLYHQRWEFELTLDELLVHQRPRTPLRSQHPVGIVQEIYALLLAHYLLRALMVAAAQTVAIPPTRLSFLETLRLVRLALPDFQRFAPCCHARIYQALLAEIAATRLPARRDRLNPRVIKRAQSKFRVKRPHHRPSPKPSKSFAEAIVLLN